MDTRLPINDPSRFATSEDVRHILGDVDDVVVAEILSARPTYQDVTEAAIWVRGDGDLAARDRGDLGPVALAIAVTLMREEEEVVDGPN